MPTYEYRCSNGHEFEKRYSTISASESEVPCPECGAVGVRHLSVGGALVFKGSGFYLTDYGKNAHATRGGAKPPRAEGESGASESSKSESSKSESSKSDSSKSDSAKPAGDGGSAAASKPAGDGGSSSASKPAAASGGDASKGAKPGPKRES